MQRVDLGPDDLDDLVPQRAPFRFLSRVHAWAEDPPFLHGSFEVSPEEPVLAGHFPGDPLWPGACTVEGLAQACGALEGLLRGGRAGPREGRMVMGRVEVRLLAPVRPGQRLDYRVWRQDARGVVRTWRVEAAVGPTVVARGRLGGSLLSPVSTG